MRGTLCREWRVAFEPGIIPAYAGNTDEERADADEHGDHPRVCGEHVLRQERFLAMAGSSPRMRGTPGHDDAVGSAVGIIPAYAGNTGF